jgi:signal transduction histidine kinase
LIILKSKIVNFEKKISSFNIRDSIEKVMAIQAKKAAMKEIDFVLEIKGISNLIITSDEKRIQQVILNLQSNALKFTQYYGRVKIFVEK